MKPVDCRNATFEELQGQLEAKRATALAAWHAHGPGTTRRVAERAGIDLLSFRPRTTELFQIGALECSDHAGHEGIYRARTEAEWQAWHAAQRRPVTATQQQFAIA